MTTRVKLCEQILYRLNGGYAGTASNAQEEDVQEAINQKVNALLKMQHFSMVLPSGETIPEGAMIAFYEGVKVVRFGNKSKVVLPAMPMLLTRNMGVFEIMAEEGECEVKLVIPPPIVVPNMVGTITPPIETNYLLINSTDRFLINTTDKILTNG